MVKQRTLNKLILTVFAPILITACSSLGERQIASMDGNSRPSWANQEKAVVAKEGKLFILGFQELGADAKISAANRLADNSVRTELSKMIQNQFSSVMQNLEEGVNDDGNVVRFYSSEVSKNVIHDLRISSRYWEKVQSFDQDGEKTYKLRVYSLGEIPEAKLKKMVKATLDKDKLDPEIKKQVLNHFENEIKQFQSN